MDILAASVDTLVDLDARLVVLGSGDAAIEGLLRAAAGRQPEARRRHDRL